MCSRMSSCMFLIFTLGSGAKEPGRQANPQPKGFPHILEVWVSLISWRQCHKPLVSCIVKVKKIYNIMFLSIDWKSLIFRAMRLSKNTPIHQSWRIEFPCRKIPEKCWSNSRFQFSQLRIPELWGDDQLGLPPSRYGWYPPISWEHQQVRMKVNLALKIPRMRKQKWMLPSL